MMHKRCHFMPSTRFKQYSLCESTYLLEHAVRLHLLTGTSRWPLPCLDSCRWSRRPTGLMIDDRVTMLVEQRQRFEGEHCKEKDCPSVPALKSSASSPAFEATLYSIYNFDPEQYNNNSRPSPPSSPLPSDWRRADGAGFCFQRDSCHGELKHDRRM